MVQLALPNDNDPDDIRREREAIRKENLTLCSNIMIFLAYLGIFTTAMFLESSDSSSRFADHIRGMLAGGGSDHHAKMALSRIKTPDDMYSFLEQTFVPSLWQNNTDTNQALVNSMYLHPIDVSNRMVGSARVRQVRVAESSDCQVDPMFDQYSISCYPTFQGGGVITPSNEASSPFGPENKFEHTSDPLGVGYSGSMGSYPSSGYMAYLSVNRTTALIAVDNLRKDKFLDLATRAVFVDFTIWNSNLGVYAHARSGGVWASWNSGFIHGSVYAV